MSANPSNVLIMAANSSPLSINNCAGTAVSLSTSGIIPYVPFIHHSISRRVRGGGDRMVVRVLGRLGDRRGRRRGGFGLVANDAWSGVSAWWGKTGDSAAISVDGASTLTGSISDVLWPSAGAFLAMAVLGRLDQILAPKLGVSITIAPLGAVCAVLLATPSSPAAQKKKMFVAQIACAAFGVLSLSIFGPGWIARSTAVAASIAFMIITRATHPPAASLPLLFIDGAKYHQLKFWYLIFPGAIGCLILCLIQELVVYLKSNWKF